MSTLSQSDASCPESDERWLDHGALAVWQPAAGGFCQRALLCWHDTTRGLFPEEERSTKYDDDDAVDVVCVCVADWQRALVLGMFCVQERALHTSRIDKPRLI